MTHPSHREKLSDRLAESAFVRNVLGPRLLKPLVDWYGNNVDDSLITDDRAPATTQEASALEHADKSPSLASAEAAEAFLAGPGAGDEPSRRTTPAEAVVKPDADPESEDATAAKPGRIGAAKGTGLLVKARVKEHNLNVVAAGIAFWTLLAIPAMLTAVVSIYGLVADPADVESQIEDALSGASPAVQELVGDQLSAVAGASSGGLAVGAMIGIVFALWTVSGAVAKLIATLNIIFGVTEDRGFAHLRGLAVAITGGAIVAIVSAAFLLAALPAVLGEAGLDDATRWILNLGRFPGMLITMAISLSVLYWIGPNRRRSYRLVTWGAVWATILWLGISTIFTIYTTNFASFNETYGSLGAVIVLLLWLFMTAFMVLIGAEIDAAVEPVRRPPEPPTAAGAEVVAT